VAAAIAPPPAVHTIVEGGTRAAAPLHAPGALV